jgi:hypothetical protein
MQMLLASFWIRDGGMESRPCIGWPVGRVQDHRGERLDRIAFLELEEASLAAEVIEVDEDEVLGGPLVELLAAEDAGLQPLTGGAPVAAPEVDQQVLSVPPSDSPGFLRFGVPGPLGPGGSRQPNAHQERGSEEADGK